MKILKIILSTFITLVILGVIGIKVFHYYERKKLEEMSQQFQKILENQRKKYALKLEEGFNALQEGNYKKAKLLFTDICNHAELLKIPEGCFNLGVMYYNGYGVDKNYSIAEQFYKKAARIGSPSAYYMLSIIENNKGNSNKSLYYAQKGCELNDAKSCFLAGAFYYDGEGVDKNISLVKKYWKKALTYLPEDILLSTKEKTEIKKTICEYSPNLCNLSPKK